MDKDPMRETMLSVIQHLNTLSSLVTSATKASTAEIEALGDRIDDAVTELDALSKRVARSLQSFDTLHVRVQEELLDREALNDDDISRIADAVTTRLLDNVRVESEEDLL